MLRRRSTRQRMFLACAALLLASGIAGVALTRDGGVRACTLMGGFSGIHVALEPKLPDVTRATAVFDGKRLYQRRD